MSPTCEYSPPYTCEDQGDVQASSTRTWGGVGPQGSTAAQFKPGTSAVVSVTKDKPSNLHGVHGSPRQATLDEGKRNDFNQPR